MKKKIKLICLTLSALLILSSSIVITSFAIEDDDISLTASTPNSTIATNPNTKSGFDNFTKSVEYKGFNDVKENDWFYTSIKESAELGLVKGRSETSFSPFDNLTLAEAVTLASRINSIYYGKIIEGLELSSGTWYKCYIDYAVNNGILKNDNQFSDYNKPATRAEFAEIMCSALPEEALSTINILPTIPDVSTSTYAYESIYYLYQAGIVQGSNDYYSFFPEKNINRAEVSTIINRMAIPSDRILFTSINSENYVGSPYETGLMGYSDLLSEIIEEIDNNWENGSDNLGISSIFAIKEAQNNFGFLIRDINGDGISELMLGEISHDGMPSLIYDLYSITLKGDIKHVFSGGERNKIYLLNDGTLINEGSNNADDSFTNAYNLENGELIKKSLSSELKYIDIPYELFSKYREYTSIRNPWTESNANDFKTIFGCTLNVPDGATNINYSINGFTKVGQMNFTLDELDYTARIKATTELTDISGCYYDWTVTEDCTIGLCKGLTKRFIGEEETADLCLWYNDSSKLTFSLSTSEKDLDGFDIQAIAEVIDGSLQIKVLD